MVLLTASQFAAARQAHASGNNGVYVNTNGFDTCNNMTHAQLYDWWNGTPWWHIGMYLGGSVGTAVRCGPMSSAQINDAIGIGFGVVLFWYGPQMASPCAEKPYAHYISLNTTTAYNQGVSEADAASRAASAAGVPVNAEIYYDMEGFYGDSGCVTAAQAFVNGWDSELRYNTPFAPSVYGSSCSSYISSYASITNKPDDIAPADQNDVPGVYNQACLPNTEWVHDQRIAQFSGEDYMGFGGYVQYFDEACSDGSLVTAGGNTSATCTDVS